MHTGVLPPPQATPPSPEERTRSASAHRATAPALTLAQMLAASVPWSSLGLALSKGAPAALATCCTSPLPARTIPSAREARLAIRTVRGETAAAFPFSLTREICASAAPTALAAALAAVALPALPSARVAEHRQKQLPRGLHAAVASTAEERPLLSRAGTAIAAAPP